MRVFNYHSPIVHSLYILDNLQSVSSTSMSQKRLPGLRILGTALIVSLGGSFHFGYQLALTNPAQQAFIAFLTNTWGQHMNLSQSALNSIWSFTVAILFLGALCGSFSISIIADYIGRKRGLYISIGLGILSAALSVISKFIPSFSLYIISRISMGYSVSLSLGLSAVFLSEASPRECRGSVGMITGCAVQLGTVIGSVLAMPQIFGSVNLWFMIYVVEFAIMIIFLCCLPLLPESPGHLIKMGAQAAALHSIQYYNQCDDASAERLLAQVKEEQRESKSNYKILEVLHQKHLRGKVFIGIVIAFAMSFSGIAVINAYAVQILRDTGLSQTAASLANVGIATSSLIASAISSLGVDRFGRRPLLLVSLTGILICNIFIFGLMLAFDETKIPALGYCLIFVIVLFVVFFSIGPGPLCYFIASELVGHTARSAAQGWASIVQMLSRFILVMSFIPLKSVLHSFAYLMLFVAPVLVSIIFLYYKLPETKNRTPDQVNEEIANLPKMCGTRVKVHDLEKASTISIDSHN